MDATEVAFEKGIPLMRPRLPSRAAFMRAFIPAHTRDRCWSELRNAFRGQREGSNQEARRESDVRTGGAVVLGGGAVDERRRHGPAPAIPLVSLAWKLFPSGGGGEPATREEPCGAEEVVGVLGCRFAVLVCLVKYTVDLARRTRERRSG